MSMEHLMSEYKEVFKEPWRFVKGTQNQFEVAPKSQIRDNLNAINNNGSNWIITQIVKFENMIQN